MTEPWQLSVGELRAAYAKRELSPSEVVSALAARIEEVDPGIGAFRDLTLDRATTEAEARTGDLLRGEAAGPLHGVPVAVKELFDVGGARTTFGSRVFRDRVAAHDAEAVRRLRQAGAVVIGLTRSHEFAWGITTQHRELGGTRNPWRADRVPGGSSGGSAAAVATGMIPLALGSDTGGSIRIPAAYCGVAGLKPTYGRVSMRGVVPLAPSLDHAGPIARRVADLVTALAVLAGYDPDDPSTMRDPVPATDALKVGLEGLRVAVCPDLHLTPLSPDHQRAFDRAVDVASAEAASVTEVRINEADRIYPTFGTIQMAEAYHVHTTVLGTFPSRADEYGGDVRRRLERSASVDVSQYLEASEERARIRRRFEVAFDDADVLLTPATAGGPSTVERPNVAEHMGSEMPFRDLVIGYTVPQNLIGIPSCTVRAGTDRDGIPVGLQVSAAWGREDLALRMATGLERALAGEFDRWPPVSAEVASGPRQAGEDVARG